jgi:hypothetical protein
MNNNFQAVPSSNTAGMTQGFAQVPHQQQQGHSSATHGTHDTTHQGHDSHNTHGTTANKREDGSGESLSRLA